MANFKGTSRHSSPGKTSRIIKRYWIRLTVTSTWPPTISRRDPRCDAISANKEMCLISNCLFPISSTLLNRVVRPSLTLTLIQVMKNLIISLVNAGKFEIANERNRLLYLSIVWMSSFCNCLQSFNTTERMCRHFRTSLRTATGEMPMHPDKLMCSKDVATGDCTRLSTKLPCKEVHPSKFRLWSPFNFANWAIPSSVIPLHWLMSIWARLGQCSESSNNVLSVRSKQEAKLIRSIAGLFFANRHTDSSLIIKPLRLAHCN